MDEINSKGMLPDGLKIVPYYDRSELVDAALQTVSKVLVEGIVLVVVVLFLFLGDLRSSLIVIATLVLTPVLTFMVMNHYGHVGQPDVAGRAGDRDRADRRRLGCGGGERLRPLGSSRSKSRIKTMHEAVLEVGTPVIFGIGIIILVFLPLMTLEGMEGKMFAPLAYTIAIALAISLVLSLTLSPVLSSVHAEGRAGARHLICVRLLKRPYLWSAALGDSATRRRRCRRQLVAVRGRVSLFPLPGHIVYPGMKEGTISPNMDRVPNISLDESIQMEMEAHEQVRKVPGREARRVAPGTRRVAGGSGGLQRDRHDGATAAARGAQGLTQDQIADKIRETSRDAARASIW